MIFRFNKIINKFSINKIPQEYLDFCGVLFLIYNFIYFIKISIMRKTKQWLVKFQIIAFFLYKFDSFYKFLFLKVVKENYTQMIFCDIILSFTAKKEKRALKPLIL